MAVKVGNSWVSETALEYAKRKTSENSSSVLDGLKQQYRKVDFSEKVAQDSESTRVVLEGDLIILEISEEAKRTQEAATEEAKRTQEAATEEAVRAKEAATVKAKRTQEATAVRNGQELPSFSNTTELMKYLNENYSIVRRGMASISGRFLKDCLKDGDKLNKLFENLAAADASDAYDREHLKGYQGMRIKIDENGDVEMESYGGWVGFNEGKRARQLDAAKTQANVQSVIAILQADLAECEAGKSKGMCDDETINKVKAMLAKAGQKMGEVMGKSEKASPADEQAFLIAGLL